MKQVSIDKHTVEKAPSKEPSSTSNTNTNLDQSFYTKRHPNAMEHWLATSLYKTSTVIYGRHRIAYDPSRQLYIHSNGWTLGYAISLEHAKRAIDILEGRV